MYDYRGEFLKSLNKEELEALERYEDWERRFKEMKEELRKIRSICPHKFGSVSLHERVEECRICNEERRI